MDSLRILWWNWDVTLTQLNSPPPPPTKTHTPKFVLVRFCFVLGAEHNAKLIAILLVTNIPCLLKVVILIYCTFFRKRRQYRSLAFIYECLSIHHLFFWLKLHPAYVSFRVLGAHHPGFVVAPFYRQVSPALERSFCLSTQIHYHAEFVLLDLSGNGLEGFRRRLSP